MYSDGRELIVPSKTFHSNEPVGSDSPSSEGNEKGILFRSISYVYGENNSDYYVSRHMGEVTYADFWIGKLIDKIKTLPGRTMFIVTADHGESFGDANLWFAHGDNVRYPCVNVPLIISCEGVVPVGVSDALVANIDLAPTILDLVNVQDDSFAPDGRTLRPTFAEETPWPSRLIPTRSTSEWRGVRSANYSFQGRYDEELQKLSSLKLYSLKMDSRERTNLAETEDETLVHHLEFFNEWANDTENPPVEEVDFSSEEEMQERIRALGYFE